MLSNYHSGHHTYFKLLRSEIEPNTVQKSVRNTEIYILPWIQEQQLQ